MCSCWSVPGDVCACVFEQRSTGQRREQSTSLKHKLWMVEVEPCLSLISIQLNDYSPYAHMLLASAQARAHGYR